MKAVIALPFTCQYRRSRRFNVANEHMEDYCEIGLPTYHTRVERWECDYNDHWNVRFFGRSFQMASEFVATFGGRPNPGAETVRTRHIRFHREMRVSDPVEIRSAILNEASGMNRAIVHLMISEGKLAATALDFPGSLEQLPEVSRDQVSLAMPRGISGGVNLDAPMTGTLVTQAELGPVRYEDLDHLGKIRFDHILRHSSNVQHIQLNQLGLTPEYAGKHRINRMGVEFRITRGLCPELGQCLRGKTWLTGIEGKTFWANNRIETSEGELVALVEMCVLTVNLDTRKAIPVPKFIHDAFVQKDC